MCRTADKLKKAQLLTTINRDKYRHWRNSISGTDFYKVNVICGRGTLKVYQSHSGVTDSDSHGQCDRGRIHRIPNRRKLAKTVRTSPMRGTNFHLPLQDVLLRCAYRGVQMPVLSV